MRNTEERCVSHALRRRNIFFFTNWATPKPSLGTHSSSHLFFPKRLMRRKISLQLCAYLMLTLTTSVCSFGPPSMLPEQFSEKKRSIFSVTFTIDALLPILGKWVSGAGYLFSFFFFFFGNRLVGENGSYNRSVTETEGAGIHRCDGAMRTASGDLALYDEGDRETWQWGSAASAVQTHNSRRKRKHIYI